MVTKCGIIKRCALSELRSLRKKGIRAIILGEDDLLISVMLTNGDNDIIIATKKGQAASFNENTVRPMGRNASGVIGIRLGEEDEVIGACVLEPDNYVLTITENGYGKLTPESEYPATTGGQRASFSTILPKNRRCVRAFDNRGGRGHYADNKRGHNNPHEISSIRICGRASQGVIVMRTIEGEKVIGIASTPPEDNHDEDENGEASGEQKAYEQDNEEE